MPYVTGDEIPFLRSGSSSTHPMVQRGTELSVENPTLTWRNAAGQAGDQLIVGVSPALIVIATSPGHSDGSLLFSQLVRVAPSTMVIATLKMTRDLVWMTLVWVEDFLLFIEQKRSLH